MSCSYAEGLSEYHDKGKLGVPEKFDGVSDIDDKVRLLTEWVKNAKHIVVHTGAGISTSAGIPDFRGPKGVWTLEKKGLKPDMNVSWDDAKPTLTHMALAKLVEVGKVKFIITQNIDGLHLRSGVPRKNLAELHGNMFVDLCDRCKKMFVRPNPAPTVGQKYVGADCPAKRINGRNCRGSLKDFVLDWEHDLPEPDLTLSDAHSVMADLSIVMGSTLQIIPAGNMPTYTKKYHEDGKLVICNLQPTKQDKKADLNIHTYVDDIMKTVMANLGLEIPEYDKSKDPVKLVSLREFPGEDLYIDWTQNEEHAKITKKISDKVHDNYLRRKREEKKRKSEINLNKVSKKLLKREDEEESDLKDEIKPENCDLPVSVNNGKVNTHIFNNASSEVLNRTKQIGNESQDSDIDHLLEDDICEIKEENGGTDEA